MLNIGQQRVRVGCGVSRRALLQAGGLGMLGLNLPAWLQLQARAAGLNGPAKNVILLWLWGGPSHIDLWDMKPAAPAEYRGPYRPIATNVPGIQISELLPRMARRMDRLAVLRSMHTSSNDHGIAGTIGLTSNAAGGISLGGQEIAGRLEPALGSIVAGQRGAIKLAAKNAARAPAATHAPTTLPDFVSLGGYLHQGRRRIAGEGGGVLGSLHDPFRLDYDPAAGVRIPQLDLLDGVTADGIQSRLGLRSALNDLARQVDRSSSMASMDHFYQQAFSLLTSGAAREVFDLSREPDALRRRYGQFRFGQCCLLARRLLEAGVGFVQVNWSSHVESIEDSGDGGWDLHDRNFPQLQDRHAWMLDQSLNTLLDDLEERGLLDSTLIMAVGEFGRTPKINNKAGRDHWEHCYSGLLAGGGLRTGQVIGSSDKRAEYPNTRPVTPGDVATTVLDRLGIRAPELTDLGLAPQGTPIEELL